MIDSSLKLNPNNHQGAAADFTDKWWSRLRHIHFQAVHSDEAWYEKRYSYAQWFSLQNQLSTSSLPKLALGRFSTRFFQVYYQLPPPGSSQNSHVSGSCWTQKNLLGDLNLYKSDYNDELEKSGEANEKHTICEKCRFWTQKCCQIINMRKSCTCVARIHRVNVIRTSEHTFDHKMGCCSYIGQLQTVPV